MTKSQQDQLLALLDIYLGNVSPEVVQAYMHKIDSAGLDKVYFAWAGGLKRGEEHYYRIHGPIILIKYDNTQNNANHIHTV